MSLLRERFYWTGDSWEYPDEWVRDHIGSGGPRRSCYRSQAKHCTDSRHNCVARRWRCVGDRNTFRAGGTATLVPFSVQSQTSETEVADATQPTFQSSLPSNEIQTNSQTNSLIGQSASKSIQSRVLCQQPIRCFPAKTGRTCHI